MTSLALAGASHDVDACESDLLDLLGRRLGEIGSDPTALTHDYRAALGVAGAQHVSVETADARVTGRLLSLSLDRGLEIGEGADTKRWVPLELVRALIPTQA